MAEHRGRSREGHQVDVVGQLPLGHLPGDARVCQRQAEPEPGHAERLGEGAQHDQTRCAVEQGNSRGAAELLIGLVTDDERAGLLEHALHRTLGQGGAGGIVRRVEHHHPSPALGRRRRSARPRRIRSRRPNATGRYRPPSTLVRRRYSENVGVEATTTSPEPRATESVAWISSLEPLPDQHTVRAPSVVRGQPLEQGRRREFGIALPRRRSRPPSSTSRLISAGRS